VGTEGDVDWFADGQRIASVSRDGKVVITDITNSNANLKARTTNVSKYCSIQCAAVSKSMTLIALGGYDKDGKHMCNIHKLISDNKLSLHHVKIPTDGHVPQVKFLDDDKVVVCSGDGTASVYDIETQTKLLSLRHNLNHDAVSESVFFSLYCIDN
jgi:WD40 repeat protein